MERRRFQVQVIVVAIAAIDDDHRQGAQLIGSTGLRLGPATFNWITAFSLDCFHIYFVVCFGNTRRTQELSHQICYSFFLGGVTKKPPLFTSHKIEKTKRMKDSDNGIPRLSLFKHCPVALVIWQCNSANGNSSCCRVL